MGKLKTIFPFVGKVQGVVGMKTKEGYILREYVDKPNNPNTSAQVRARAIFKSATNVASLNNNITLQGLRNTEMAQRTNLKNAFVSLNIKSGTFTAPDNGTQEVTTTFVPEKLIISQGNVTGVNFSNLPAEQTDSLSITVGFSGNLDVDGTSRTDKVYIAAMLEAGNDNVVSGQLVLSEGVDRSATTITMSVPSAWVGADVHVWGFVTHQGASTDGVRYDNMMSSRTAQVTSTEVLAATEGMTYSPTQYLGMTKIA